MSTATVVAKGKLTQFRNVNYLAMDSFEVLAAPKQAKEAKTKDETPPHGGDGPARGAIPEP
jgi:hypothetical protein